MKKTLIALMALAGVAAAEVVRDSELWTMTFGTDINGTNDYKVTGSFSPTGVWDVNGLTGSNYVSTNGSNKRVHIQGNTGLTWASNFEFEIVFTLPDNFNKNSNWPVLAEISGNGGSLRFGPYTESENNFYIDGTLSKNNVTSPLTLTTGVQHTATITLYEGSITLKLDGAIAQTGTLNSGLTGVINNVTLGGNSGGDYRLQENVYSISAYSVKNVETPEGGGEGAVPEPTTATLSLLALAGLAARRRRK